VKSFRTLTRRKSGRPHNRLHFLYTGSTGRITIMIHFLKKKRSEFESQAGDQLTLNYIYLQSFHENAIMVCWHKTRTLLSSFLKITIRTFPSIQCNEYIIYLFLSSISVAPTLSTGHPWNALFHFSFLIVRQPVGTLGQGDQPVARPLPTWTQNIIYIVNKSSVNNVARINIGIFPISYISFSTLRSEHIVHLFSSLY
jgi:hypothetical protein